jgi:hypothetical protein
VVVHGPAGGFTAGQTELLDNVPSKLDHRIDDVLYQPRGVGAVAAEVLGEELRSQPVLAVRRSAEDPSMSAGAEGRRADRSLGLFYGELSGLSKVLQVTPSGSHGELCGAAVASSYAGCPARSRRGPGGGPGCGARTQPTDGRSAAGRPCGAAYPPLRMPAGR